ncbi:hypothetical protein EJB05_03156 [Eragrostis curvula]|uniref:Phospho-2-dehydro-3-deoxyheptonate aldolase n=1 Tax=Eragrostis curvula TaxID=38414 RepID=A0A5J9WYJ2_9POAL|nr:hypothetical protein EJB05_03156 [Eragrostis curvula]
MDESAAAMVKQAINIHLGQERREKLRLVPGAYSEREGGQERRKAYPAAGGHHPSLPIRRRAKGPSRPPAVAPLKKKPAPAARKWAGGRQLEGKEGAAAPAGAGRGAQVDPDVVFAEAALGRAFVLQGGDCAESFKEFSAHNIRDTFCVLLQMGAVLIMFGGQVPIVKVGRGWLASSPSQDRRRSRRGMGVRCYAARHGMESRLYGPQQAGCQSVAALNLLRAFATGGYAAMPPRVTQWNLDFMDHNEQGDRHN